MPGAVCAQAVTQIPRCSTGQCCSPCCWIDALCCWTWMEGFFGGEGGRKQQLRVTMIWELL